jgi:transcriptional regulator GlxA family with amidase domain
MENYVHLVRIGPVYLFSHVHLYLAESTAQVIGEQGIPIAGQVLRRKQLPGGGIQQGSEGGVSDILIAFKANRTHAHLPAFVYPVNHGERRHFQLLSCCSRSFNLAAAGLLRNLDLRKIRCSDTPPAMR